MLKSAAFLVVAVLSTATALPIDGAIAQTATGSATAAGTAGSSNTILNPAGLPITTVLGQFSTTENGQKTTTTTKTVTEPASSADAPAVGSPTAPAVGSSTPVVLPSQLLTIIKPTGSPLRITPFTSFPTVGGQ